MKVGLTYDLRQDYLNQGYSLEETAELDRVDTIDLLEEALQSLGFKTERIGGYRSLMDALIGGQRWDIVFNIAEGLYGMGRESLVPCLLDAYQIPYTFSDPMVTALTLHKGMCKRVIRDLGIPTPDFRVIESARDLESASLAYPLFVKPVAEGTAKGISSASKIDTFEELKRVAGELLVSYHQPVLVETYLPGREFTVGIVGTGPTARSVGVLEVKVKTDDGIYSYESKEHYEEMVEYTLLKGAPDLHSKMESIALEAWRGLGCRDGGRIDLRLDQNGSPMFLEVNPLAGLHPFHSDLPIMCTHAGISYYTLISWIMSSAIERVEDARRSAA